MNLERETRVELATLCLGSRYATIVLLPPSPFTAQRRLDGAGATRYCPIGGYACSASSLTFMSACAKSSGVTPGAWTPEDA